MRGELRLAPHFYIDICMQKIDKTYDLNQIQIEIDFIVKVHGWWNDSQISLQSPNGEWHDGVGTTYGENFKETDFKKLNTEPHWEISKFITENNLYRTRILKVKPGHCYSYHKDFSKRIHLAVTTHPHCFLVIDKQLYHVPADSHPYLLDTTLPHTAMNASLTHERIHVVGCTQ